MLEKIVERKMPEKIVNFVCCGYNVYVINSELSDEEKEKVLALMRKGAK